MTDPPGTPTGPWAPRRCQYCAKPAEVFDLDGAWCSPQCQTYDRQSEITFWRNARGGRVEVTQ